MVKPPQKISIVIPVFNEAQTLQRLYHQIRTVLDALSVGYEIIFVDDGSTDGSFDVLEELYWRQADPTVIKFIRFRRNRGKAAALAAGFAHVTGDVVVTMDADLQDDPSEIPKLLAKLSEGYDLVSGWKFPRSDSLPKRLLSFFFNKTTCLLTGVALHDINCGFKAYRTEVVKGLHLYGDLHRYTPIIAHQNGYRIAEVKVKHHPRLFGRSKYGWERIPRGFFDLLTVLFLTRYLQRPMHFFGVLGLFLTGIGFFINLYLAILWFIQGGIGFRPLLMLGILLMILGGQFFSIGLLGEMLTHAISCFRPAESLDYEVVEVPSKPPSSHFKKNVVNNESSQSQFVDDSNSGQKGEDNERFFHSRD